MSRFVINKRFVI